MLPICAQDDGGEYYQRLKRSPNMQIQIVNYHPKQLSNFQEQITVKEQCFDSLGIHID